MVATHTKDCGAYIEIAIPCYLIILICYKSCNTQYANGQPTLSVVLELVHGHRVFDLKEISLFCNWCWSMFQRAF